MKLFGVCLSNTIFGTYAEHSHSCWEITINVLGSGTNFVEGRPEPFSPGTILICPPGVRHGKRTFSGCFQDLYIYFGDTHAMEALRQHTYQDDAAHTIETLMRLIHTNYFLGQPDALVAAECLTETVLQLLTTRENLFSPDSGTLGAIQLEIIRNFSDPDFRLQDVLDRSGYSPDHLRSLFRQQFGCTPLQYLRMLRIEQAKDMLQQAATSPAQNIGLIAMQCGFYDSGYFTRVFRQETGRTPSQYSRDCRRAPTA